MNPQAKKIWRSPKGASLFRKMLYGQPITSVDRQTLNELKLTEIPQASTNSQPVTTPLETTSD